MNALTIPLLERLADVLNVPLGALLIDVTARPAKRKEYQDLMDSSAKIIQLADKARQLIHKSATTKSR